MSDTLKKWGKTVEQFVKCTDTGVVLRIDEDEVTIPKGDVTLRKALWSDVHWIIARILETATEPAERNYERTSALLLAGERLVALCRRVLEHKDYAVRSITLARCVDAYDAAKRHASAPSAYERLRDPNTLEGEPEPPPLESGIEDKGVMKAPSLPEPETEALYQVLYHWQHRLKSIDEELQRIKTIHRDGDPNAPCPEDLAKAYTRFFKAKNVVDYLVAAIHEQLGEHLSQPLPDGEGLPIETRIQIRSVFMTDGPRTHGTQETID